MAIDKAVDSEKLDADLASVADAIRAKGGTSEKLAFPAGYVDAVNAIQTGGGGGQEFADSIIDRSITEITSEVRVVGKYALTYCASIVSARFPRATSIESYAFNKCVSLKNIELPQVINIGYYSLGECNKLEKIELPYATSILGYAFYRCSQLQSVIIATNKVCQLADISTFNYTPIKNGTGYIYVPKALVEEYKAATNWSTFAAQIRAIEDYPDITGG